MVGPLTLALSKCVHLPYLKLILASGGYYGFRLIRPPPQCVERFHRYRCNEKHIIASILKFARYIHNHKILPCNIFGFILKKTRWLPQAFFRLSAKTFVGPLEQRF